MRSRGHASRFNRTSIIFGLGAPRRFKLVSISANQGMNATIVVPIIGEPIQVPGAAIQDAPIRNQGVPTYAVNGVGPGGTRRRVTAIDPVRTNDFHSGQPRSAKSIRLGPPDISIRAQQMGLSAFIALNVAHRATVHPNGVTARLIPKTGRLQTSAVRIGSEIPGHAALGAHLISRAGEHHRVAQFVGRKGVLPPNIVPQPSPGGKRMRGSAVGVPPCPLHVLTFATGAWKGRSTFS